MSEPLNKFVQAFVAAFGRYTNPDTGMPLLYDVPTELANMESLLAKAYAEIEKVEQQVDAENDTLRQQLAESHTTSQAPHDGGFILTVKGRQVGTPEDRKALDTIIDRVFTDDNKPV